MLNKFLQRDEGTVEMGLFISFEGIDCSGKTTQIEILRERVLKENIPALFIREPGSTAIGEKIREILLSPESDEMCMTAELFLYSAARAQLVREVIRPALGKEKMVFCDRYTDSTLAYQGYGARYNLETIKMINEESTGGLSPHITFIMDIDVPKSFERLREKNKLKGETADRIESRNASYYERVRQGYLNIARSQPERVTLVPDGLTIEEVSEIIQDKIRGRFNGGF